MLAVQAVQLRPREATGTAPLLKHRDAVPLAKDQSQFDVEPVCAQLAAAPCHRTTHAILHRVEMQVEFFGRQLVTGTASGSADEVRAAHARYFAGREADILALWDSPRQREAYDWFTVEFGNLRAAFRWAADQGDLDVAAAIATYTAHLGTFVENFEPIAWAEELIEPARAVNHSRLATLYVMASMCWMPGRIEAALRYSDAGPQIGEGHKSLTLALRFRAPDRTLTEDEASAARGAAGAELVGAVQRG